MIVMVMAVERAVGLMHYWLREGSIDYFVSTH